MAIRRLFSYFRMHANAAASTRAQASAVDRGTMWRRLHLLRQDAMAAAAARGQKARACAFGRIHTVRADGEDSAVACAAALARAAQAIILRGQREAGAAAAFAGHRLRQAADHAIYTYLWIAYGESAPIIKAPSSLKDLHFWIDLFEEKGKIPIFLGKVDKLVEQFHKLDASSQAALVTFITYPFSFITPFITPADLSYIAPEPFCPFWDTTSVALPQYPVEDCLAAVVSLAGSCGGVLLLTFAALCLSFCQDVICLVCTCDKDEVTSSTLDYEALSILMHRTSKIRLTFIILRIISESMTEIDNELLIELVKLVVIDNAAPETSPASKWATNYMETKELLDLTCQTVAEMIKGKTPEEIRKTFNIKNAFTRHRTPEEIRKTFIINHMIEDDCTNNVIPLPNVDAMILAMVIEYWKKHLQAGGADAAAAGDADKDCKTAEPGLATFDKKFVEVDQATLLDLILAVNYMDIKELLDLTRQAVADMMGKSPEEIRKTFNIKNDFTKDEAEEIWRENPWAFE